MGVRDTSRIMFHPIVCIISYNINVFYADNEFNRPKLSYNQ